MMMPVRSTLVGALLASLSAFAAGEGVELVPQFAESPWVFASEPNEFSGTPDAKSMEVEVDSSAASAFVKDARQSAVRLRIRATRPDTKAVEISLHQRNGQVWGSTSLTISPEWRDITLSADRMTYFRHWGLPALPSGSLPDLTQVNRLRFCFGKWLCGDSLDKAHGFEVQSVRVVPYQPHEVSELGRACGWDVSLDEFPRLAGEEDDTERVMRAVEAVPRGGVLFFPRGTYDIASTIYIDNGSSLKLHKNAILRAVKEMPFVVDFNAKSFGSGQDCNGFITGGVIDGAGLASCLKLGGFAHFTMRDTTFLNGKESGLRVVGPSYELIAHNLYFRTYMSGLAGNTAVDIRAGDSHYVDCVAVDYTIGFAVRGGGSNRLTRCHVWGGPVPPPKKGELPEMLKGSINFLVGGASTILRDCYADTGEIGYKIVGWDTRMLGCSYFNNKVFRLDNITIIKHERGRLLVTDGGFVKTTPNVKVYEGCGEVEWQNMMYSGFGEGDYCPGAKSFKREDARDQKALKLAGEND